MVESSTLMVQFILATSKKALKMAKANWLIQTVQYSSELGKRVNILAIENTKVMLKLNVWRANNLYKDQLTQWAELLQQLPKQEYQKPKTPKM